MVMYMYSKSKLIKLAKEEKKTSIQYKKKGFSQFAKDEARHAKFFAMLAKRKK